jgi:hypothetical protein
MFRLLLISTLLSVCTGVRAQILFERGYPQQLSLAFGNTHVSAEWSASDHSWVMVSHFATDTLFITKTDSTGFPLWTQKYGVANMVSGQVSVAIGASGNIFVSGQLTSQASQARCFILCTGNWGNALWLREYISLIDAYAAPRVKALPNGDLLCIESLNGEMAYFKTDAAGNVIQSDAYRDNAHTGAEISFDGDVFDDGTMIFVGSRGSDLLVLRTASTGQLQWSAIFNAGSSFYQARSVLALSDRSAMVSGFCDSHPFVLRIDHLGAVLWYRELSTFGIYYDIAMSNDNTFRIAGQATGTSIITKVDAGGMMGGSIEIPLGDPLANSISVAINPDGLMTWPFVYQLSSGTSGSGMVITNQYGPSACVVDTILLAVNVSAPVPVPVSGTITQVSHPVTSVPVTAASQVQALGYLDYCWIVGETETLQSADERTLRLQSNYIGQEQELAFYISGYDGAARYSVTDVAGKTVAAGAYINQGTSPAAVALPGLAPGIYLLSAEGGGHLFSERFVVR